MPAAKTLAVHCGGGRVIVKTLEGASREFRAWIEANDFGASDLRKLDGNVVDATGKTVAHISYNGRIWSADRTKIIAGE